VSYSGSIVCSNQLCLEWGSPGLSSQSHLLCHHLGACTLYTVQRLSFYKNRQVENAVMHDSRGTSMQKPLCSNLYIELNNLFRQVLRFGTTLTNELGLSTKIFNIMDYQIEERYLIALE